MPIGAPDWSDVRKPALVHRLDDMAELAARLDSLVTFDRRGDVEWADGFEHGLGGWHYWLSGTGAKVEITTSTPFRGGFALRLVGGSDADRYAWASRYLNPRSLSAMGLAARISLLTRYEKLLYGLDYFDGELIHRAFILFWDPGKKIYYLAEDGTWKELGALFDTVLAYGGYQSLKLVANFAIDKYVRFILNEEEYDLTDKALYRKESVHPPCVKPVIMLYSRQGVNDRCQVDDVVFTINEP